MTLKQTMINKNRELLTKIESNGDTLEFWLENPAAFSFPHSLPVIEQLFLDVLQADNTVLELVKIDACNFMLFNKKVIRDSLFVFNIDTKQYALFGASMHPDIWEHRIKQENKKLSDLQNDAHLLQIELKNQAKKLFTFPKKAIELQNRLDAMNESIVELETRIPFNQECLKQAQISQKWGNILEDIFKKQNFHFAYLSTKHRLLD